MHPYFHVAGHAIPAFGTMLLLAGLVSFGLMALTTCRTVLWQDAFNYYFFALAGALSGAALLYAALSMPAVVSHWPVWRETRSVTETLALALQALSGLVYYGGLLGGAAAAVLYSRVFKTPLLPYLDVFAPIVPVLHAIGRVGCFLGGCCYGIPVADGHPLGVVYPPASLSAPSGVTLLAVPLIEAGLNLALAAGLFLWARFSHNRRPGVLAAVYCVSYAILRFILEFFRGDAVRGVAGGVSTSQIISVGLFLVTAGWLARRRNLRGGRV